jgi:Mg-chelatase subunit ChlD
MLVHRKLLDLCFVMDATGSMGHYIKATRSALQGFAQRIYHLALKPNVAYSLVLYRDHPPHSQATFDQQHIECYPFSESIDDLQQALEQARAHGGGGDGPEAVADGLYHACNNPHMHWRSDARKIIVLVGDSAPHGFGRPGDNYPEGCPCEKTRGTIRSTVHEARQRGITVLCLGIGDDPFMRKSFALIAEMGGGQYTSIANEITLIESVQAILVAGLEDTV